MKYGSREWIAATAISAVISLGILWLWSWLAGGDRRADELAQEAERQGLVAATQRNSDFLAVADLAAAKSLQRKELEAQRSASLRALEKANRIREEDAAMDKAYWERRRAQFDLPGDRPQQPEERGEPFVVPEHRAKTEWDLQIEKKRAFTFDQAIKGEPFRRWITFGGTPASSARITNYRNGVFTLTKDDGKTMEVRISRFAKADRDYVEAWMKKAGVSK